MAYEIKVSYTASQSGVYAVIHNNDGLVWNRSNNDFEEWITVNLDDYKFSLSERGSGSGLYISSIDIDPSSLLVFVAGKYIIRSFASDNSLIGSSYLYWDGDKEIGEVEYCLKYESLIVEPEGIANNLWDMIIQLWMRFFNKVTKTSTTISVYKSSNVVMTEQAIEEGETTDTINKATEI